MTFLRKFICLLLGVLVSLVLLMVLALLVLRFSPQTVVGLANRFSPYDVVAETASLRLMPLMVEFGGFKLVDDSNKQIADLKTVALNADWVGAIRGRHNFWNATLSDGQIDLREFTDVSQSETAVQTPIGASNRLDIHRLLSALSAQFSNIKLIVNEHSYVDLQEVSTGLNDNQVYDNKSIKQVVKMRFIYDLDASPLAVDAVMESKFNDGVTDLKLHIKGLDLTSFAPAQETAGSDTESEPEVASADDSDGSAMDWSWLDSIEPIRLNLVVDQLKYTNVIAQNVLANIKLDKDIDLQLSAAARVKISDDLSFDDKFEVIALLKPIASETIRADFSGKVTAETSKLKATAKGEFNVNGPVGNDIEFDIEAAAYPLISQLDLEEQGALHAFFPAKARLGFADQKQKINLTDIDLVLGVSDIKGDLEIKTLVNGKQSLSGKFISNKVVLDNADEVEESENKANPKDVDKEAKLFSDQAIDWAWLDNLELEIGWQAKLLQLGKFQFSDLQLPLTISQGNLNVESLKSKFANGSWTVNVGISKQKNGVQLELQSELQNAVLEAMNLIPKDQISAGNTNLQTNLVAQGNSLNDLAASLDGDLLLEIEQGVIGNDYFELIGSDIITGLLNKLNPFVKSDPSTNLECMVANLKVDQGDVLIDKSVAVETSKIAMAIDGAIDLDQERINLKIVPKSASGVGVGANTLVKSITLGGTLANPAPKVTAGDLLKSGLAVGAALSTGGVSVLADGVLSQTVSESSCERAKRASFDGSDDDRPEDSKEALSETQPNPNPIP